MGRGYHVCICGDMIPDDWRYCGECAARYRHGHLVGSAVIRPAPSEKPWSD